jgi:hypothetical protein
MDLAWCGAVFSTDKVSHEARAIAEVKLMGGSDPARQNQMLDLARGILQIGRRWDNFEFAQNRPREYRGI